MAIQKELFINSLEMIQVDGRQNIPSVVLYDKTGIFIGHQAIEKVVDATQLNENFKLNLGESARGRLEPPRFETGDGKERSAHEITKNFIENLLKSANLWIADHGLKKAKRVLVAEPLALDREKREAPTDWLANYRAGIRSILSHLFDEIDFLPEPFAVFQYYRYGIRHPLLIEKKRHVALVIDFGGGTFDVSVVETTASGDVSASGRNSRPLAAASVPVGGAFLNWVIAKELLSKNLDKGVDRNKVEKAWVAYRSGASEIGGFNSLSSDIKTFIRLMKGVIGEIEKAKIHISETIADWSLAAIYDLCPAAQIGIPRNPFSEKTNFTSVRFDAYNLRDLFINRVWKSRLCDVVKSAISRGGKELEDRPIDVVLLSGGSANIGWLSKLINEELSFMSIEAETIELQNSFQEIVSKGLAIECARRTYNEGSSDFKAVTYNRLCLVLASDDSKPSAPRFKFLGDNDGERNNSDGTLLKSAHILTGNIGSPIRWKFKLSSPPKHRLNYFFLKSSLDYEDISSVHNVDSKVYTPARTNFDSHLEVELNVREDGTAYPKFIYRRGKNEADSVSVEGTPFFMDMTSAAQTSLGEAYIGLDFGTSNSSVSYVEQNAVRVFTQRAGESGWMELNELVNSLPYPVANPLANFLCGSTHKDLTSRFPAAFESLICFCAYISYIDYCQHKDDRKLTSIYKSFTKSSAGPLWALLRLVLEQKVKTSFFQTKLSKILQDLNRKLIDDAIEVINGYKHHRNTVQIDYHKVLGTLGNILASALQGWHFGIFEGVTRVGFGSKYSGLFRVAHGKHAPFIDASSYVGTESFSEVEAVLVNSEKSIALRLMPFLFWQHAHEHGQSTVAVLDYYAKSESYYRTVEGGSNISVNKDSPSAPLLEMVARIAVNDVSIEGSLVENFSIDRKGRRNT